MDRGRTGDGEYRSLKSRSNTECGPLKLNEDGPCPVLLAISDIYRMAFWMDGWNRRSGGEGERVRTTCVLVSLSF